MACKQKQGDARRERGEAGEEGEREHKERAAGSHKRQHPPFLPIPCVHFKHKSCCVSCFTEARQVRQHYGDYADYGHYRITVVSCDRQRFVTRHQGSGDVPECSVPRHTLNIFCGRLKAGSKLRGLCYQPQTSGNSRPRWSHLIMSISGGFFLV